MSALHPAVGDEQAVHRRRIQYREAESLATPMW